MALILQFPDSGLTGVDRFALEAGSLSVFAWEQSWSPDQGAWSQLESDDAFPDDLQDHSATIHFRLARGCPDKEEYARTCPFRVNGQSSAYTTTADVDPRFSTSETGDEN